jgi:hypothetical protein
MIKVTEDYTEISNIYFRVVVNNYNKSCLLIEPNDGKMLGHCMFSGLLFYRSRLLTPVHGGNAIKVLADHGGAVYFSTWRDLKVYGGFEYLMYINAVNPSFANGLLIDNFCAEDFKYGFYVTSTYGNTSNLIIFTNCRVNCVEDAYTTTLWGFNVKGKSIQIQNCLVYDLPSSGNATIVQSGSEDVMISGGLHNKIWDLGTRTRIFNVYLCITSNYGSSTIPNGQNHITINHGCEFIPKVADITLTLETGNQPETFRFFWIVSLTSTSFTVYSNCNAEASGISFMWSVRRIP